VEWSWVRRIAVKRGWNLGTWVLSNCRVEEVILDLACASAYYPPGWNQRSIIVDVAQIMIPMTPLPATPAPVTAMPPNKNKQKTSHNNNKKRVHSWSPWWGKGIFESFGYKVFAYQKVNHKLSDVVSGARDNQSLFRINDGMSIELSRVSVAWYRTYFKSG
jgi:hypothetical protein